MIKVCSRDSPLPNIDYIKISGGIYLDCIIHDFDMLRFVTGKNPKEIFSVASSFFEGIGACGDVDNVLVTLKYDDGMIACIDVSRFAAYGYDQRVEAFGSKGCLSSEHRTDSSTCLATKDGLLRPVIHHSFP
jgi:myo-inositol 2-dehydrogenase/D-chiro-inositol 1-dehydrogenase